ncbi:MAG: YbaB/EbfC family nucleoid-associated protein [Clostridia bacterium]|nr:YbaB/EbfC family nucleoid-associated protein [Clostridia bacterium]MDD4799323.1 YbaB/EbfC family nucleoid-associated protein [Clostridia bacterium]
MNMQKLMQQAQKMQAKMASMQEELAQRTVDGTAGGGMVKATVNGQRDLLGITIDPEVIDPDDIEMLEDLIVAAVNDAMRAATEMAAAEMQKITGGMGLPPGMF